MSFLMVKAFNDAKEVSEIKAIFQMIDKDFSGIIEKEEIIELGNRVGITLGIEEVEKIIDSIYFAEKGVITFTEFEAAMLNK